MKIIYRLTVVIIFFSILTAIIAYARGYRLDFEKKSVTPTGILAVTSTPKAAKVYVNGELKGATDINLTLPPGKYQVEIKKDGYTSWAKTINLKGELVESADGLLFPTNPSLSPLTNLGVVKVLPIDGTNKLLVFSDGVQTNGAEDSNGIYVFDLNNNLLSFLPPLKAIILKKNLPANYDLSKTNVTFSPDLKQGVFDFTDEKDTVNASYLLSLDEENTQPFDISKSKDTLTAAWETEKQAQVQKILETFPKEIKQIATDSFRIYSFSPDETKMLYQVDKPIHLPSVIVPPMIGSDQEYNDRNPAKDNFYVYNKKDDINYKVNVMKLQPDEPSTMLDLMSVPNSIYWYPDSRHFVFMDNKKISVVDFNGQNKQVIYSGPFQSPFFTVTPDGKIIVLANLNPDNNKFPDLYLVGIR